jgi:hypothetical protein
MVDRFTSMLDCVDLGFLPADIFEQLPLPAQIGATRVGGVDPNRPRIRAALAAVLALTVAPAGFTVARFTAKVQTMIGQTDTDSTIRQAAYDLRKLRSKQLVDKPGWTRRYHVLADGARAITALLTIRDQVLAPLLAGVRSPRRGRPPATLTQIDRDYETLRVGMQTLFHDLGILTEAPAAAWTTSCPWAFIKRLAGQPDSRPPSPRPAGSSSRLGAGIGRSTHPTPAPQSRSVSYRSTGSWTCISSWDPPGRVTAGRPVRFPDPVGDRSAGSPTGRGAAWWMRSPRPVRSARRLRIRPDSVRRAARTPSRRHLNRSVSQSGQPNSVTG